jgi:hypothetical protein
MAGMIKHLVNQRGVGVISSIFSNITGGATASAALVAAVPQPVDEWHHGYFMNWLKGGIYPFDTDEPSDSSFRSQLTPKSHSFGIKTAGNVLARTSKYRYSFFKDDMLGLSANLYRIMVDQTTPFSDQDYLAFKLSGGEEMRLSVALESAVPKVVESNSTDAVFNSLRKTSRMYVLNLKQIQAGRKSFLALVSNNDNAAPLDTTPMRLDFGLVRPWDGTIPFSTHTISSSSPHMDVSGSMTVNSLIGYQTNMVSIGQRLVVLEVWKDGSILMPVTMSATPLESSWLEPDPGNPSNTVTVTISGVSRYVLTKTSYPVYGFPSTLLESETNQTGQFTLTLADSEEDGALFLVEAQCDGVMRWPDSRQLNVLRRHVLADILVKRY